jgi:hypothetical protein
VAIVVVVTGVVDISRVPKLVAMGLLTLACPLLLFFTVATDLLMLAAHCYTPILAFKAHEHVQP